jgi:hypothetical protein
MTAQLHPVWLPGVRRGGLPPPYDASVGAVGLGDLLAGGLPAAPVVGPEGIERLREHLDAAARAAAAIGGWTDGEPLRLSKRLVTGLLRCPRSALADLGDELGFADEQLVGLIVDAAAKLATVSPRRAVTVADAVAFPTALGDPTVADRLSDLGDAAGALLAEAGTHVDRLTRSWPAIDAAWWPRVEEPVRVPLAGGAVTVAGRLDVLLGGPPTGRPGVVVEVKAGSWYDGMRADAHLYALLVTLRDGEAPAAAMTVVADGTTQVEPVRPAVLEHAAERLEAAMGIAARLAAGEPPPDCPGPPACRTCGG